MVDQLLTYFLAQPRRLVALGRALVSAGGFLLLLGVVAHAATASVGVVRGMAGQTPAEVTLAAVLPSLPTWWVPEGPAGFALASACVVAGLIAARTGSVYERLLTY
jgi:hypothetical protein